MNDETQSMREVYCAVSDSRCSCSPQMQKPVFFVFPLKMCFKIFLHIFINFWGATNIHERWDTINERSVPCCRVEAVNRRLPCSCAEPGMQHEAVTVAPSWQSLSAETLAPIENHWMISNTHRYTHNVDAIFVQFAKRLYETTKCLVSIWIKATACMYVHLH